MDVPENVKKIPDFVPARHLLDRANDFNAYVKEYVEIRDAMDKILNEHVDGHRVVVQDGAVELYIQYNTHSGSYEVVENISDLDRLNIIKRYETWWEASFFILQEYRKDLEHNKLKY